MMLYQIMCKSQYFIVEVMRLLSSVQYGYNKIRYMLDHKYALCHHCTHPDSAMKSMIKFCS